MASERSNRPPTETPERNAQLPEQFLDLAPYLDWALLTEQERTEKRVRSAIAELDVFYRAMFERTPEIVEYLSTVDTEDMDDEQRTLLRLSVAFAEIADAVDFYSPDSTAPIGVDRFTPVHDGLSWSADIATSGR